MWEMLSKAHFRTQVTESLPDTRMHEKTEQTFSISKLEQAVEFFLYFIVDRWPMCTDIQQQLDNVQQSLILLE